MKTFTPTDIQRKGAELYNAVQASGAASIKHKGRPDMIVMTEELLNKILTSETQREVFIELNK